MLNFYCIPGRSAQLNNKTFNKIIVLNGSESISSAIKVKVPRPAVLTEVNNQTLLYCRETMIALHANDGIANHTRCCLCIVSAFLQVYSSSRSLMKSAIFSREKM